MVLLLGVLAAPAANAATYYVATTGNDSNTGLTPSQAWRTIQRAVNQPVAPGDVVLVSNGTYVGWATSVKGTAVAPIHWVANGNNVVINQPYPGGPGNPLDNIRLMYADYNIIDGFESTAAPRAGIAVRGDAAQPIVGAVVRNCYSHDNHTWGLFDAFADDCLYEYNTLANSCVEHGIYHSNSGDGTIIRFNHVYGNARAGIHNNGDESQGGDGVCSELQIVGNVIHGNGGGSSCGSGGGAAINMDGVQRSLIADNLLYDNHASGIIGYRIDAAEASKDNVIVNNTVIMASNGRWALKLVDGSTDCTAFDNVLYQAHSARGAVAIDNLSLAGFRSDYNVVVNRFSTDGDATTMPLAQWQVATGQDFHSILVDPTTLDDFFVAPVGNDWHLASGSPALDAGVAGLAGQGAPPYDFEGDARPAGAAFDIGCDEVSVDADGDGVADSADCAPAIAAVWAIPSVAQDLLLTGKNPTTSSWSAPADPGTETVLYDLLRSTSASNFGNAVCVASDIVGQSAADSSGTPATIFYYLVRSESGCGGNLGTNSAGVPRSGRGCP